MIQEDKDIIFWLNRVLEEKTQDIEEITKRIRSLNYQQKHFKTMREEVQKRVIEQLLYDLEKYGWKVEALSTLKKNKQEG